MINAANIVEFNNLSQKREPREIIRDVLTAIPNTAISFSGAEDIALVVMAWKINKDVQVFCLDTGRLHAQTYRFLEQVRTQYKLNLEILTPDTLALQKLVTEKGLFSFYQDGHEECCAIRKIEPLRLKLATVDAWMSGQRRDQSPTRTDVPVAHVDTSHCAPGKSLLKFNPLANWSSAEVWNYIRMFEVPFNPLHEQGYISIGCEPCTRPVGPNQHEREGRWWWEEATQKECGLHKRDSADIIGRG